MPLQNVCVCVDFRFRPNDSNDGTVLGDRTKSKRNLYDNKLESK